MPRGVPLLVKAFLLSFVAVASALAAPRTQESATSAAGTEPGDHTRRAPESGFSDVLVVTASGREEALADAPAAVTVLDGDTLEGSPGADFGDWLRTVPGVNSIQVSARDINVTSRAATSVVANSQLVLLDGRPINSSFFGNVPWDLVSVGLQEIDRVEVIRGPASAVWGTSAMTGVVNVITRPPRVDQGTAIAVGVGGFDRPEGGGEGEAGELFRADFAHSRAIGDRLAYRASLGMLYHDPLVRPSGEIPNQFRTPYPPFENDKSVQPRANLRMDYQLPDRERLLVLSTGYAGTEGIQLTPGGPFRQEPGNSLSYLQAEFGRLNLSVRAFVNWYDAVSTSLLSRGPDGQPIESSFETWTYQFEIADHRQLGRRHLFSYGGGLTFDRFDLALAPEGSSRDYQGLYLEDRVQLGERARWLIGGRLDFYSILDSPVFSPRTALLLTIGSAGNLRIAANRAYRAPSLFDNYVNFDIFGAIDLGVLDPRLAGELFPFLTNVRGRDDLQEVTQTSYEIGYAGTMHQVELTATYYYSETENEILPHALPYTSFTPPPGWPLPPQVLDLLAAAGGGIPAVIEQQNIRSVHNQGVEVGVDARLGRSVHLFGNYSWQDEPGAADPTQVLNIPPEHRAHLGTRFTSSRFDGELVVSHAGDAFWADVLDARFHGPTPSFTTVNLGAVWRWREGVETAFKVTNLLNERVQHHVFGDLISRRALLEIRFGLGR